MKSCASVVAVVAGGFAPSHMTKTGTTANAFKYTAKELSLFLGLPVYDYTARHTLPQINRFRTPDPLAEDFVSFSPYSFCGGDPINYIDENGKSFKEPKQRDQLIKKIDDRIGRLQESTVSDAHKQIAHLNRTKEIINKMDKDGERIYQFNKVDNADECYIYSQDEINISIQTSEDALSVHEIEHIGQSYDTGSFKYDKNGRLRNTSNVSGGKAVNEAKAYRAQYSFKPSSLPKTIRHIGEINIQYLISLCRGNSNIQYKFVFDIPKKYIPQYNKKIDEIKDAENK